MKSRLNGPKILRTRFEESRIKTERTGGHGVAVEGRDGRLLREIIEQDGVEGFLSIENRVNASISTHNTVIATGGSVIFGDGAMFHLSNIGTIVYLRASYETVASRVTNLKGRGVAMKPAQTLREIYEERKDLYEKFAEYIIDVDSSQSRQPRRNSPR